MKLLLDTNVLSEVRKGRRAHPAVQRWWRAIDADRLFVSVLVLGEIRFGLERVRPRDPAKAEALEAWLQAVKATFSDRMVPIDIAVTEEWGRLNAVRTLSTVDGLLAASAKVHDMTLVTRNVSDVEGTGARVLDPFVDHREVSGPID